MFWLTGEMAAKTGAFSECCLVSANGPLLELAEIIPVWENALLFHKIRNQVVFPS